MKRRKEILFRYSHAIVSLVRPRSFVSPLLRSLGLLLYRKYSSRNLLEISVIYHPHPNVLQTSFCQFVFDNTDFNGSTIDGMNTFHTIGGIKCITPGSMVENETEMTKDIGKLGYVPLQVFENTVTGLGNATMEDLQYLNPLTEDVPFKCRRHIMDVHRMVRSPRGPRMERVYALYVKRQVIPLPFINSPPTNYGTIYTVLQFVADECPLYLKCREIVEAFPKASQLSSCIVRLGGFHLLMPYSGCIGYIMAGSGLKELLCSNCPSIGITF
ncbi:hypothetical protein PR048_021532 [Dryococelus australis]|uniref:Uncharacterized protein n=1 Tax=Dryococelus australis TaxID=614101 RepID=A0ABQ9GYG6_9NEOP|nr:hypothetical protein PR048_021532 [Dryococelus australis]